MTDDPATYFAQFGMCCHYACEKPATGEVRGSRNQSLGKYCERHGGARVAKAEKERAKAAKAPT